MITQAPLALIGFMVGLLTWNSLFRIFISLLSMAYATDLYESMMHPTKRQEATFLWILLLTSGVWIIGVGGASYHFGDTGWGFVLGGAALVPLLVIAMTLRVLIRQNKRAS